MAHPARPSTKSFSHRKIAANQRVCRAVGTTGFRPTHDLGVMEFKLASGGRAIWSVALSKPLQSLGTEPATFDAVELSHNKSKEEIMYKLAVAILLLSTPA